MRGVAIAIFYAFGTALGGVCGPAIFGRLIESGSREAIFLGYVLGGVLMIGGGVVQATLGINCQRVSLGRRRPPALPGGRDQEDQFSWKSAYNVRPPST